MNNESIILILVLIIAIAVLGKYLCIPVLMLYAMITGGNDPRDENLVNNVADIMMLNIVFDDHVELKNKIVGELNSKFYTFISRTKKWTENTDITEKFKNEDFMKMYEYFHQTSPEITVKKIKDGIKSAFNRSDLIEELTNDYLNDTTPDQQNKFMQDYQSNLTENKDIEKAYIFAVENRGKSLAETMFEKQRKEDSKIFNEKQEEYRNRIISSGIKYTKDYITKNMSINLLWYNKELVKDQEFLFPTIWERQGVEINIPNRIAEWSNNYEIVNIWYDSKSKYDEGKLGKIINDTQQLLSDISHNGNKTINLIDIHKIPIISNNYELIEPYGMYFIVDWVRVCMTDYYLNGKPQGTFFLYSDMSYDPAEVIPDKLLTPMSVLLLNRYGMFIPATGRRYENSLHMMGNHKPNLTKSFKTILVDYSLQQLNYTIRDYEKVPKLIPEKMEQLVWGLYPLMFALYYDLEGFCKYNRKGEKISSVFDGYLPDVSLIRMYEGMSYSGEGFINDVKYKIITDYFSSYKVPLPIHTTIKAPTSHFG